MGQQNARTPNSEGGAPPTLAQAHPEVSTDTSDQSTTTTLEHHKPRSTSNGGQDRSFGQDRT